MIFRILAACYVTCFATASFGGERLPIPESDLVDRSTALVWEVFEADYQNAKTPSQRRELAKKVLALGKATTEDSTGRYALFRIAMDVASKCGDTDTAFAALHLLNGEFEVDDLVLRANVLSNVVAQINTREAHRTLAPLLEESIDLALVSERFDVARKLHALALDSGKSARSSEVMEKARLQGSKIDAWESAFNNFAVASNVLSTRPSDPEASQIAGIYQCFFQRDWKKGIHLLGVASDAELRKLSKADAADKPDALAVGDGWWNFSEQLDGWPKESVRCRAVHWYRKALPHLTGLPKSVVEGRLAEFSGGLPIGIVEPGEDVLDLLHQLSVQGKVQKGHWRTTGGVLIGKAIPYEAIIHIGEIKSRNYDLAIAFTVRSRTKEGFGDVIVTLPRVGAPLCVRSTRNNKTVFGFWGPKGLGDPQTSSTFDELFTLNRPHSLDIRVREDGLKVHVLLDDRLVADITDFTGVKRSLGKDVIGITLSPSVVAEFKSMTVTEAK